MLILVQRKKIVFEFHVKPVKWNQLINMKQNADSEIRVKQICINQGVGVILNSSTVIAPL